MKALLDALTSADPVGTNGLLSVRSSQAVAGCNRWFGSVHQVVTSLHSKFFLTDKVLQIITLHFIFHCFSRSNFVRRGYEVTTQTRACLYVVNGYDTGSKAASPRCGITSLLDRQTVLIHRIFPLRSLALGETHLSVLLQNSLWHALRMGIVGEASLQPPGFTKREGRNRRLWSWHLEWHRAY